MIIMADDDGWWIGDYQHYRSMNDDGKYTLVEKVLLASPY